MRMLGVRIFQMINVFGVSEEEDAVVVSVAWDSAFGMIVKYVRRRRSWISLSAHNEGGR